MDTRISRRTLEQYTEILTDRDKQILAMLRHCKFMLTGQIQRLFITDATTQTAALRAAAREMKKLKEMKLVKTLERRIGGVRAGSTSFVWLLTETGDRFLHIDDPDYHSRKRHLEPSLAHLNHTLAISECYVQIVEICRKYNYLELLNAKWEPACWHSFEQYGKHIILKPDLFISTANDGYEDRWFIEMDLDTESSSTIITKCDRYRDYYRTKQEQKRYGVFPLVVWIAPTEKRKEKLQLYIRDAYPHGGKLFIVITPNELEHLISQGFDPKELC